MLALGMLLSLLIDWALSSLPGSVSWRLMVGLPAFPGALLGVAALSVLPESPRWLVQRGQLSSALAVLQHVMTPSGHASLQQVGGVGEWLG